MFKSVAAFVILAVVDLSTSYPAHPHVPADLICDSMEIGHGQPAQNSPSPYSIKLSSANVKRGQSVNVTISSTNNIPFRGVLLEGRCDNKPVGTFTGSSLESTSFFDCDGQKDNGAMFITKSGDKFTGDFTWKAPANSTCDIDFYASIVQTFAVYWVKQKAADVLTISF